MDREVVVQGGGKNLYRVNESNGKYTAYRVDVGIISNSYSKIGEAHNLDDALTLINNHAGRPVEKIKKW